MTHEEIKILISAYIDGEANPSEKNIVEEHLSTCPACQKDINMYRAISSSLSKWSDETLSPDEAIKLEKRFEQRREPMFTKRTLMTLGTTLALTIIIGSVVQLQVKKGVQGILKSSTDDMGDQYSNANTSQFQARASGTAGYMAQPTSMRMAKSSYAMAHGPMYNRTLGTGLVANQFMAGAPLPVRANFQNSSYSVNAARLKAPAFGGLAASYETVPSVNYDRKIIRNAQITLKVKNAQKTQSALEDLVGRYNGTVNSLNMDKLDDTSRRGVMVFSVPPQSLDKVLAEIRTLGEVDSENQAGSDVTNQYAYVQARLANYETQRGRLQKILKKNANDVDNNVYIEGQIANIEDNMNSLQNTLKELDKQSFMATVIVNFYDTAPVVAPKEESLKDKTLATLKNNLKSTLVTCYYIGVNSFSGIIIVLSFLLQIGLWALLFWGIYLIVRKFIK